jgi:predicted XRE-type DNA-binding protein
MDRAKEIEVVRGSENVFADLGFSPEEAVNLKIRADLMLDLKRYIQKQSWTQVEAAAFFEETQPRISNLLNGDINRFSIDKLIIMLTKAGMQVKIEIIPQAA